MSMINSPEFQSFFEEQSSGYDSYSEQDVRGDFSFIDYIITVNQEGAMRFCTDNGFVGYLAPEDASDLKAKILKIIADKGDNATIELLRQHPEYGVFEEVFSSKGTNKGALKSRYATGGTIGDNHDTLEDKVEKMEGMAKLLKGAILVGIAYLIWKELKN